MHHQRSGFTLIELLVTIAIIGMLSGIVIHAINPKKSLGDAMNASRKHAMKQIESAMLQVLIDSKNLPSNIPGNKTSAKDICQDTVTGEACTTTVNGVDLSILKGTYIAQVPIDPEETGAQKTGYRVYRDGSFYKACSPRIDSDCGDSSGGSSSSSSSSTSTSSQSSSTASSVASACTPTTYASTRSLALWLDAQAGTIKKAGGSTAGNGESVALWEDTYLSQNDFSQAQSSLQPIHSSNAVVFDGHDDTLNHNGNITNFVGTTFVVFKNTGGSTEQTLLSIDGGSSQIGSYLSIKPGINAGGDHGLVIANKTQQQYYGANTCLPINANTHYIAFQYETTGASAWLDGVSQSLKSNGSYESLSSTSGMTIGAQVENMSALTPGATTYNGNVLEVIAYTQKLSTAERHCIDAYLQNKWNIPSGTSGGDPASCITVCCGPGGCNCGNHVVEGEEECDDGNLANEDGCNMYCKNESSISSVSSSTSSMSASSTSTSVSSSMGTSATSTSLMNTSIQMSIPSMGGL